MASGETFMANIDEELLRLLQDRNEILAVSLLFAKLKTNEQRVSFAYDLLNEHNLLPALVRDAKSSAKSVEYRKKGNEMFKQGNFKEAHNMYTKSIVLAESKTEPLALAYANRSAVLFDKHLYEDCLRDIQLALENNYPEHLKPKLDKRKSSAERLLTRNIPIRYQTAIPQIAQEERNALIQSAANSVKIEYSETLGRHVVATRAIEPGEIIAVEKAYCHGLHYNIYIYCHCCLKLCYSLFPCANCTQALFCSKICQSRANTDYHQFECPILVTAKKLDFHKLLHLKLTIVARDKYNVLDQCSLKPDETYRSDRYDEIYNLVANTSSRSVSDLFGRAVSAASFYHLMKSHTTFFENQSEDFGATFKELLLFHMQAGPCNFHEITSRVSTSSSETELPETEIGAAAFSFLSLFNHSCCPNVTRYGYGPIAVVISLKSIQKGEQCFDNYGQHYALMVKEDRRAKLKRQYLFDCNCEACLNDYPLYDSLPVIADSTNFLSETIDMLQAGNLEAAKKTFPKMVKKIKEVEKIMPNQNLGELQEALKQCCFIFSAWKSPI